MRTLALVLGWIALVLGVALLLLAVLSWPPEGLFFGAPYLFGVPGLFLTAAGGVLLWVGGRLGRSKSEGAGRSR